MVGNLFFRGVKIHPPPMAGVVRSKMAQAAKSVNIAEILSMSGQRSGFSCPFVTEEMHLGKKVAWKWNNINDYLKYQYDTFHQSRRNHPNPESWKNHSNPAWRNSGGNWHAVNEQVMRNALTAAFLQNPAARERLAMTGDKFLVADGKGSGDFFWGWQNGYGENKLGHILMDLRERLHPDKAVLFYERGHDYFEFTNFYEKAPFFASIRKGEPKYLWRTSEHYFQARKFAQYPHMVEHIANLPTAREAFDYAKQHAHYTIPGWRHGKSDQAMLDALRAKFKQNPHLRQKLLNTEGKELIENTSTARFDDPHWGVGRDGQGRNKLGKLLMHVREEFRTGAGKSRIETGKFRIEAEKCPTETKMPPSMEWLNEPWSGDEKQRSRISDFAPPPAYFSPNNLPKHHALQQAPGPQKIHYQNRNALPVYPAYNHPQTQNINFAATRSSRPLNHHNKALPDLPGKQKKGLGRLWPDFLKRRKVAVAPNG